MRRTCLHWLAVGAAGDVCYARTGAGFTLVQGPPGTGKTRTVIAALNTIHLSVFKKYRDSLIHGRDRDPELLQQLREQSAQRANNTGSAPTGDVGQAAGDADGAAPPQHNGGADNGEPGAAQSTLNFADVKGICFRRCCGCGCGCV